jgi:hypothetical protein
MDSTRGSTPPNPNFNLRNRSTESIAMILSTQTCQIKRNRRNPAKTSSNPSTPKTPESSPLTHGFGRGITAQRTTKGSHKFPPTNPQEQGPENTPRKPRKEGTENHHQEQLEQHNKALRNHAKSSIHNKKVHTRSSLPPDHPILSQDLTMKLSS